MLGLAFSSKLSWFVLRSFFLVMLPCISINLPYACMEYCHLWAGFSKCGYLELLDKRQNGMQDCWSFTCCLSWTAGWLSKFSQCKFCYRYYFGRCSSELAQQVPLPYSRKGLLIILIDFIIFLSPFLDITRIYMPTVSFLAQLGSGILCLELTDTFWL